jgi:hypothetical protein
VDARHDVHVEDPGVRVPVHEEERVVAAVPNEQRLDVGERAAAARRRWRRRALAHLHDGGPLVGVGLDPAAGVAEAVVGGELDDVPLQRLRLVHLVLVAEVEPWRRRSKRLGQGLVETNLAAMIVRPRPAMWRRTRSRWMLATSPAVPGVALIQDRGSRWIQDPGGRPSTTGSTARRRGEGGPL